jgi:hypothetical protein
MVTPFLFYNEAKEKVCAMTLHELIEEAQNLSFEERKELLKILIDSLELPTPKRRVSELAGLGKEIWQGIDAQDYVNQMRDEWDTSR